MLDLFFCRNKIYKVTKVANDAILSLWFDLDLFWFVLLCFALFYFVFVFVFVLFCFVLKNNCGLWKTNLSQLWFIENKSVTFEPKRCGCGTVLVDNITPLELNM